MFPATPGMVDLVNHAKALGYAVFFLTGRGDSQHQATIANLVSDTAAGLPDLATVTIFCSDVKHYDAFNQVYRTYFTKEYPARAFIGAGTLLFNARFEVQGIAVKR